MELFRIQILLTQLSNYKVIFIGNNIYIYIYRERERERKKEMGSSYTWCNLTRFTLFIDRKFVIDLMVKKKIALNAN